MDGILLETNKQTNFIEIFAVYNFGKCIVIGRISCNPKVLMKNYGTACFMTVIKD